MANRGETRPGSRDPSLALTFPGMPGRTFLWLGYQPDHDLFSSFRDNGHS